MTVDDARMVFGKYIIPIDRLLLTDGSTVDIIFFANVLFKEASANPTYDEMVDIDGGTKGYISFFDQCKADGVLA